MPALTTTNATQAISKKRDGREFDEISDAVDEGWCSTFAVERGPRRLISYPYPTVNVQMLKLWDDESEFDAGKDKARFRQYDDACDRVKNFYKEQHGMLPCLIVCGAAISPCPRGNRYRKADCCVQHPGSSQLQEPPACPHGHLGGYGDAQHPCGRVRS
jgi:hypothetical protein